MVFPNSCPPSYLAFKTFLFNLSLSKLLCFFLAFESNFPFLQGSNLVTGRFGPESFRPWVVSA